jgi:hypothetical protein
MGQKYKKYRTFYLPKEIVDFLFVTAHVTPIADNKDSEIIIGLSVINEILSKSNQYRSNDDYPFHYIPMDSRYLLKKYGNDYKRYIQWLDVHNIIWHDEYYEGKTTYYYLQNINLNAHPFSYQFPLATAIVNLSNIPPPKYLRLSL